MKVCSVKGCKSKVTARGLCRKHYRRLERAGELHNEKHKTLAREREDLLKQGKMKCCACGRIRPLDRFSARRQNLFMCDACERHLGRAKAYGIARDQFRRMLKAQLGRCAICNRKFKEGVVRCCVDHNHSTGQIRGLLCDRCNRMLGAGRDNAALLYMGARYLDDAEQRAIEQRKGERV